MTGSSDIATKGSKISSSDKFVRNRNSSEKIPEEFK